MAAPKARVIREGKAREIDSSLLVPGDIVALTSGVRVPADLRLIEATRLEAEEAALTGESVGVAKQPGSGSEAGSGPAGRTNGVLMGTTILSGRGLGVVTATGSRAELRKIAQAVQSVREAPFPLEVQLSKLGQVIGAAVLAMTAITVVLGGIARMPITESLLTAIALAVAAVPEGLPIVVTVTLAVGVRRMARRNVIIRRLPAVETLGSCTVTASDKTGTLTKNEMTVREIRAGGRTFRVSGIGFEPWGEVTPVSRWTDAHQMELGESLDVGLGPHDTPAFSVPQVVEPDLDTSLKWTLLAGLLANESELVQDDKNEYRAQGDPTEVALIAVACKAGLEPDVEAR
jgi:Ca2+-transporting ATPase